MLFRATENQHRIGLAILRVIVGIVFLMHGIQKLKMGHAGVTGFFGNLGIPAPSIMAGLIMMLETLGAASFIAGFLTRVVAAGFIVDMLGAILTVHLPKGFSAANGGYEFPLTLLAAAVALAIAGPGAAAVDNLIARRTFKT